MAPKPTVPHLQVYVYLFVLGQAVFLALAFFNSRRHLSPNLAARAMLHNNAPSNVSSMWLAANRTIKAERGNASRGSAAFSTVLLTICMTIST